MKKNRVLLLALMILLVLLGFLLRHSAPATIESSGEATGSRAPSAGQSVDRAQKVPGSERPDPGLTPNQEEGLRWATARRERMLGWMTDDPERALSEAVSWAEYEALPAALKPFYERPFNERGTLRVLPVCNHPEAAGHEPGRVLELGGRHWNAAVCGRRMGIGTKEDTPLAGITLGDRAVVAENVFEILSAEDEKALAGRPLANPHPDRDFATGELLGATRVTAVAGGRRYLFATPAAVASFNRRLGEFDATPGPHGGSRVVFELADGGEPGEGFDWEEAGELVADAASSWTETPKSVFFIRIDFPDLTGESVSEATLAGVLNTTVTDSIEEMSYGKTSISAVVSPVTVRMPQDTTYYLPSNNTELRDDAMAAYEAMAGSGALGGYDIVGVHFASIGIQSSGVTYAGLAGGSRQWLQGTTSSNVIIHEFGHNYGIGHASFWETSDGSVVGAGASLEYGDPFDIMGNGPDPEGHFHMQAKSKLNWLEASQWTDASAAGAGTYRVYRFDDEATTGGTRGLRVTKAASPAEYYWLGYRPGIPANPWLENGAYLVWQRPNMTRSWLLDTTAGSPGGRDDAALGIGTTYSDSVADLHFTPVATGGAGAEAWIDLNIQIGPFPGNGDPTSSLVAPATAAARNPVVLSAGAGDPDGDPLAYSWDFGDGTPSENLAAVSHTWTVGGSYTVEVTVSDMKGGSVTESAVVVVSDPLDTWSTATSIAGRAMRDVEYLDGRYLAGANGYLFLSFDGLTWDETLISSNYRPGGFASDGDRFVAASYDWDGSQWVGAIHASDEGRSWQAATMPAAAALNDVAAGGGAFVAVGDGGAILRSVDGGETWTAQSAPGAANLAAVAYGGGTFVAVGQTSVYTSADGVTWQDRSGGTTLEPWHSFRDVIHVDGVFYAGGWYSGVHLSIDGGVNWQKAVISGGASYDITALAAGAGVIVATAERRSGVVEPVLLASNDGLSWSEGGFSPFPDTSSLTYGDGVFSTVHGSNGEISQSALLVTPNAAPVVSITGPATGDARDWLVLYADFSDPDGDPLLLLWDFKDGSPLVEGPSVSHSFPVGGSFSVDLIATDTRGGVTRVTHAITVSDPLDSWTQRASGTSSALYDIAWGGGTLVAVGGGNGTYRTSADGMTWTGGIVGANIRMRGVVHDGSQFVAAGYDYDFGSSAWVGVIYTSPDGSTWTRRLFSGEELNDIALGAGKYVAVGDVGAMWTSADGITWSPEPSGTTLDLNGVSYGDGVFVAAGSEPDGGPAVVLGSADGTSWTDLSGGAGTDSWQGFYDVEFCHDRFLASGWYSKIRHSIDGGVSFATNESGTRQVPAFAHGNGLFLAAGIDKGNGDADINMISSDGGNWTALATVAQGNREAAIFYEGTFITVGQNGEIWQSAPFVAPQPGGYAGWVAMYFPGTPPLSGPEDDYDGDGIPNLAEYATGTDPMDPASRFAMLHGIVGDQFTMTLPKVPGRTDVTVAMQYSTDLETWSDGGMTIVEDSATRFVVKITALVSSSPAQRGFLRPVFTLIP